MIGRADTFPAHLMLGRMHIDIHTGGKNLDAACNVNHRKFMEKKTSLANVHNTTNIYTISQQQKS